MTTLDEAATAAIARHAAVGSDAAPAAIGPYSQAVRAGDLLFISGQLPADPGAPPDAAFPASFAAQTTRALANVTAILEAAGLTTSSVVKTTIFTTDLGRFAEINEAYADYFDGPVLPARATVGVAALPKGAGVEIEAVALMPGAPVA